jgi:hypothetical protein
MAFSHSDSMPTARISPRRGVYFAAVDGEGVLMDIVANRYYGLTAEAAHIWQSVVVTSTAAPASSVVCSSDCSCTTTLSEALDAWRASNLLECPETPVVGESLPVSKEARQPASVGLPDSLSYRPTGQAPELKYFLVQFVTKHYGRIRATVKAQYAESLYFMEAALAEATIAHDQRERTIERF